jgi:hypothetical protein
VSNITHSLALEIKESEIRLEELRPLRHLSITSVALDRPLQLGSPVVKVSGSITVSF